MVLFDGVRFVLAGFDEAAEQEFLEELEGNGGQYMGRYSASCTHVIVSELALDDPICVAAQKDGKELVTDLWVADCLQSGTLIDTKLVLYRPLKDLNGIPGSDQLVICLTGYQGQARTDIVRMVDMMGARFTKPLVATKVTHLVCYKFEGEKYDLAKRLNLKLVNHRWLEDCLLAWALLPEEDYQTSGFDLEFGDAEAKDSEDNGGTPESHLRTRPKSFSVTPRSLASQQGTGVSTPKRPHDSREKMPRSSGTPSSRIRMLQSTKKGKQLQFQAVTSTGLCMAQHQSSPHFSSGNKEQPSSGFQVQQDHSAKDPQTEGRSCPQAVESSSFQVQQDHSAKDPQTEGRSCLQAVESSSFQVQQDNSAKDPQTEGRSCLQAVKSSVMEEKQVSETSGKGCSSVIGDVSSHPQVAQEVHQISDQSVSADIQVDGQMRGAVDDIHEHVEPSRASIGAKTIGTEDEAQLGGQKGAIQLVSSETNTEVIEGTAMAVLNSFGYPKLGETGDSPDDMDILQESRQLNQIIASNSIGGKRKLSETSTYPSALDCANQEQLDQPLARDNLLVDDHTAEQQYEALDVAVKSKKLRPDPALATPTGSNVEETGRRKRAVHINRTPKNSSRAVSGHIRKLLGPENVQPELDFYEIEKELCDASGQGKLTPSAVLQRGVVTENNDEARGEEPGGSPKNSTIQARAELQSTKKKKKGGPGVSSVTPLKKRPRVPPTETKPLQALPETPAMVPVQLKRDTRTVKRAGPEVGTKTFSDRATMGLNVPKFPKLVGGEGHRFSTDVDRSTGQKDGHVPGVVGPTAEQLGSGESSGINERREVSSGNEGREEPAGGKQTKNAADVQGQGGGMLPDAKKPANGFEVCTGKEGGPDGAASQGAHASERRTEERLDSAEHPEIAVFHDGDGSSRQTTKSMHKQMTEKEGKRRGTKAKVVTKRKGVQGVEVLHADWAAQETLGTTEMEDSGDLGHPRMSSKRGTDATDQLKHEQKDKQRCVQSGKSTSTKSKSQSSNSSAKGKCFGIGGRSKEKETYKAIIKKLGGKLTNEGHKWEERTTHLVLPSPLRRTEKFFAGAAGGRWLLRPNYLDASDEAKRFVDEEDYEWHGCGYNEEGNIGLDAPRKWRRLRDETGCGALHKLRIVIYGECTAPTQDTLSRVIKAGGGKVLSSSPPYDQYLTELDFALVNRDIPSNDKWITAFVNHGIACVAVDYLVDYVCKPSSCLEKHILHGTGDAVVVARTRLEANIAAAAKTFKGRRRMDAGTTAPGVVQGMPDTGRQVGEGGGSDGGEDDIVCSVCGKGDNGDVMMLCGDEDGVVGCGVAVHIYCCKPPLQKVPVEDWLCKKCAKPPPRKPRRVKRR